MENRDIIQRLDRIENQMKEMKELIINIDADSILTPEEEERLEESLEEHRRGESISLEDLKKELGDWDV